MTAIPADGDRFSDQRPMVSPPNTEGNTWYLDSAPPPIVLQPNPIVLQRGTATAVDNSIANLLSEGFDDDPCRRTHHDIPRPLLTSPNTPNPPVNPDNQNNIQTSQIDLDALERKILRIGEKINRLLSVNDGDADDDDTEPTITLPTIPLTVDNSAVPSLCNPTTSPATLHPRVDLDAIECKIRRSLAEDFLHLPADDGPLQLTLWQIVLRKDASMPPPTPVDMDALEVKIWKSLKEDLCHLAAKPPDPAPPTDLATLLPAATTPLPALTAPLVPLLLSNPAQTPTPPAAPPDVPVWVPPDPPPPNNLPDVSPVAPIANNNLPVSTTILPKPRRKLPPSSLAPLPKRARITLYFSPHPGGSLSPSSSTPLPPFHPVLMCTPDKYTQHNFRPP